MLPRSGSPLTHMLLKRGMEGPDVLNLELALQGLGYKGFAADGIFDQKTENVVRNIQKTNKLTVDGLVGPKTLAVIDKIYQPAIANFAPKATPVVEPITVAQPVTEPGILTFDAVYPKGDEELADVHPILARKVLSIIELAAQEGYILTVVQGLRTFAEQDRLFKKRPRVTKARGGQSYHNYGVAVDIAFIVNGKLSWDEKLYKNVGRWAGRVGLEWGGNWHFVDMPHLQLNNMPATARLLATYNANGGGNKGVSAVWKNWIGA